jgi:N-glycosylase/DNA lyase
MSLQTIRPTFQYRLLTPFHPDEEVLPGVRFGREDELLTPAYWAMRCATADPADVDFVNRHGTLEEEVGFCLLGGFGVTLEVATAFFERLRANGVFERDANFSETDLFAMLDDPADVHGRAHRYRFPKQRARRLRRAMADITEMELDETDPIGFREQIQSLEGVGPKTASWIARNWLDTDAIAILDIHVLRAGWLLDLFDKNCQLPRDYLSLESRFLSFAENLHVRASVLDSVMWLDMRTFGSRLAGENLAR